MENLNEQTRKHITNDELAVTADYVIIINDLNAMQMPSYDTLMT